MRWKSGAVGLLLLVLSFAANSTPIQYEFEVLAGSGPLLGTSASGSFSFDDSLIPTNGWGWVRGGGLITQLDFTWDGIHYTSLPLANQITLN